MFRLAFKKVTAPKSWYFVDPDTGHKYEATDKSNLLNYIVSYRKQNNLPDIDSLESTVEHYLCHQPENAGSCFTTALKRGFMGYVKGGVTLFKDVFIPGNRRVPLLEAERRAAICEPCPLNVFPDKDVFLEYTDAIAKASLRGLKTSRYKKLGNCAGCSCPLNVKVWVKGPFTLSDEEKTSMQAANDKCWQLTHNG